MQDSNGHVTYKVDKTFCGLSFCVAALLFYQYYDYFGVMVMLHIMLMLPQVRHITAYFVIMAKKE